MNARQRASGPESDEVHPALSGGRLWLLRLSIAAFGFVLVVGGVEVLGRLAIWWRHGVPGKTYGLWQPDAELGAIHASNAYNTQTQTNSGGFRGGEDVLEPKPPGSTRVICYGGSTTFCYNLADGDTWPQQLQERLRKRPGHDKDQVLNGGHISWSLGHLYLQAKRDVPLYKPDVVVIYAGVNELTNLEYLVAGGEDPVALEAGTRYGLVARNLDQTRFLKQRSVIVRFLDYYIKTRQRASLPEGEGAWTRVAAAQPASFEASWAYRNYVAVLGQMVDLVRANGGTPLFVVEVHSRDLLKKQLLEYSARGQDAARSMGVAVCDPRAAFARESDKRRLFYETGVHVSADGARLLADEVFTSIDALEYTSKNRTLSSYDGENVASTLIRPRNR